MTSRYLLLSLLALGALFFNAGCEPRERVGITAEVDDPGYRRGKELLRQGRNQEALAAFLKLIEKRGEEAGESHLEVGLLYQFHIKDPIAAIYHYRKFRELKPNSPQSDLVRQRIDGATREFASTLPGDPLNNAVVPRYEGYDQNERLQRENETLKAEAATLRAQMANRSGTTGTFRNSPPDTAIATAPQDNSLPSTTFPAVGAGSSIAATPPGEARPRTGSRGVIPPLPTPSPTPPFVPPTRPAETPASAGTRRHVVTKGDTLMGLAVRYYGDRSRWREIFAANRSTMRDPNDLRIGNELRIP